MTPAAEPQPEVHNFEVRVSGPVTSGGARVDVRSPGGDVEGRLNLAGADRDRIRAWFEGTRAGIRTAGGPTPEAIGEQLFRALFHGPVMQAWQRTQGRLEAGRFARLRLVLHQVRRDASLSRLLALPWELLYDPGRRGFVSDPYVSIVRRVEGDERALAPALAPPLRLLAVWAQPPAAPRLDLEHEWELLRRAARATRAPLPLRLFGVDAVALLKPCTHATLPRLRERLERPFDVLHFMGHGSIDEARGEGCLVFEDDGDPRGRSVPGSLLADNLTECNLRLVVLSACGPWGPRAAALRSVAEALVRRGVPAVLAMQAPIHDDEALAFMAAFYARLLAGEPIEVAVHDARMALRNAAHDEPAWAIPALYVRAPAAPLFERRRPPTRTQALALGMECVAAAWLAFVLAFLVGPLRLERPRDWLIFNSFGIAAALLLALRLRTRGFLKRTRQVPPWWLRVPVWLAGAASAWAWL